MKDYAVGMFMFVAFMGICFILGMVPEPANLVQKFVVVIGSILTLGLGLWVNLANRFKRW